MDADFGSGIKTGKSAWHVVVGANRNSECVLPPYCRNKHSETFEVNIASCDVAEVGIGEMSIFHTYYRHTHTHRYKCLAYCTITERNRCGSKQVL